MPVFRLDLERRVTVAEDFLLGRQDAQGLWPDFELAPGRSEAWTTAGVAFALAQPPLHRSAGSALRRAADALHRLRREGGWGYNRHTAADADTTSWTLRFLTQIDDVRSLEAARLLMTFVDGEGSAHTFRGDRFGTWSGVHADVAPLVGLALDGAGASEAASMVRAACSKGEVDHDPPWRSFWWTSDAYAVARNLELLSTGSGVSAALGHRVAKWLGGRGERADAFELSQLLDCALRVANPAALGWAERLLRRQRGRGDWPASACLRVPAQHPSSGADGRAGGGGLFITAMAILSLKDLLQRLPLGGVSSKGEAFSGGGPDEPGEANSSGQGPC